MLTSCSSNSAYKQYDDAYKASGQYQSYTNKSSATIIIDDEDYQYDIDNTLYFDNGELSIYSINKYNGNVYTDCKINVQDGKIYYDCAGAIKYYENFNQDLSNMNDLYFTSDDYDKAETKDGELIFTMNKAYCQKIIEESIMDVDSLNGFEGKMIVKVDNGNLISQSFDLTFNGESNSSTYSGSYRYSSNYEDINNTTNEKLADTSVYVDINSIVNNKTLDELKDILLNEQGYKISEQGLYVCDFNGDESYIFDFNNKQFTYVYGLNSYTYNWNSQIGTYDKCVYNFDTADQKGICSEEDLQKIEDTRLNYYTELAFCGMSVMPEE